MSISKTNTSRTTNFSSLSTRSSILSTASAQRRIHRKEFAKYYADLCQLQHSHPLHAVKQHLDNGGIDIVGDRIKFDEWYPIISALSWDTTLHSIAFRLRYKIKEALEAADTEQKARSVIKQPVVTTKFVLYWMIESIKQCLTQSPSLTVLELEGLPLKGEYVIFLAQGLQHSRVLQHLSLSSCSVGDEGAEVLSLSIKDVTTLTTLDLSQCDLTEKGAMAISKVITHQKLNRYSKAWEQTLRYRDPDVEAMPGLRRLTLNHNPDLGDQGIRVLTEELRDDLWLRALDIQDTGLTLDGGIDLIQLVRSNPNIAIVDARGNSDLPENIVSEIMSILAINNADKNECEYKWISKNVENTKKSSGRILPAKIKPWGAPSVMKFTSVEQPIGYPPSSGIPTNCIKLSNQQQPTFPNFIRSQSSLTPKATSDWREQARIQECETLKRQLNEISSVLNLVTSENNRLVRDMQELKLKFDKCDMERQELLQESENMNVITEETSKVLSATLSQLIEYFQIENDDLMVLENKSDIPALVANIQQVLNRNKPSWTPKQKFQKQNQRKKHFKENEQVIWEEDETVTTERSRKKNDMPENKAQEIFARLLKNRREEILNSSGQSKHSSVRRKKPFPSTSTSSEESS